MAEGSLSHLSYVVCVFASGWILQHGHSATTHTLRAPKGVKYTCELTGAQATVSTQINGVTYYYA